MCQMIGAERGNYMGYIHKLPFIMGVLMAVIVGAVNYQYNSELQDIYFRMTIGLIVFFIIGLYVRNMLLKIIEETEIKIKKIQELELLKEQELHRINQRKIDGQTDELVNNGDNEHKSEHDYRIDGSNDDFTPLTFNNIYKDPSKD